MLVKKGLCCVWLSLSLTILCYTSAAAAKEEGEHISVIQKRLFDKKHEISFEGGYTPTDFYDSFPFGISYTYHFSSTIAWEVLRFEGSANSEKEIVSQLVEDFQVEPTEFDSLTSMVHTSFVYKPTYGKDALLNRAVINHESFLTAGVGMATYETDFPEDPTTSENALVLSFGMGRKYFIGKNFAFIFSVRDLITFKEDETENSVYLGIGLSYRFDFAGKKAEEFEQPESVYKYLRDEDEES